MMPATAYVIGTSRNYPILQLNLKENMMIIALGAGFITPPLGLNLFVVSGLTSESILKIT